MDWWHFLLIWIWIMAVLWIGGVFSDGLRNPPR